MARGDRVPHRRRQEMQRYASGIHSLVRHARRVDACRRDQSSSAEGRDRDDRARPVLRRERAANDAGRDISPGMPGEPLFVEGSVSAVGGGPLPGATIDVWHSDKDGYYDVQHYDEGGATTMRARFRADASGRFWFWTIVPSFYPIPDDGPVGDMLRAQGRHPFRPAHVHFMISAPGYETLVTHVFIDGDKYLDSDVVFGVKDSLIRKLERRAAGAEAAGKRDRSSVRGDGLRFCPGAARHGLRRSVPPKSGRAREETEMRMGAISRRKFVKGGATARRARGQRLLRRVDRPRRAHAQNRLCEPADRAARGLRRGGFLHSWRREGSLEGRSEDRRRDLPGRDHRPRQPVQSQSRRRSRQGADRQATRST